VGFIAHFANKGAVPSGRFTLKWFIDGVEVMGGTHSGLAPGEQDTAVCVWAREHDLDGERLPGSHTVRFTVDSENTVAETYESNNSLEDRMDAISLVLAVTPEL
jgi:subtilase family serine protease